MTDAATTETLHVSAVAIGGRAVLIEGPSGAGKSDLALRLIDRGAILVSDDYTVLSREGDALIARPPATIVGKIEVRGVGIVSVPYLPSAPVVLLVRLDGNIERMPEDAERTVADVAIPMVALNGIEASTPIKVELALARIVD